MLSKYNCLRDESPFFCSKTILTLNNIKMNLNNIKIYFTFEKKTKQ